MIRFGYKLSSEEQGPRALVRLARAAEEMGFEFAALSDHYHPWVNAQGHSPFAWSVLGAIAEATSDLDVITGVTCPTMRTHPAIVAHAAATTAVLFEGRFAFGLGSGENLNEHVLGGAWPRTSVRIEMLEEAVEVMRKLWGGDLTSHRGRHYTVENARLFDLPDKPIPLLIAASGPKAIKSAGRIGDGFIGLAPNEEMVQAFRAAGGEGKPAYCEINVCYADDEERAKEIVYEYWPVAGVAGSLMAELPLPSHFEAAASMIDKEDAAANVACGPDPDVHIENIRKFVDAGYDHLWIHQIGPEQDAFLEFYASEVLPKVK